jgi:hypothetical protein
MAIYKNVLLVEGQDEKRTIPELIELNGINWGSGKNTVVHIKDYEGYENILKPGSISTELKADGIEALGILLDADEQPQDRWIAIRNACRNSKSVSKIPEELPEEGLIIEADNGVRVGIWIMPDNKLPGMLETFLGYLLPTASSSLWEFAGETIDLAKEQGAPFTDYLSSYKICQMILDKTNAVSVKTPHLLIITLISDEILDRISLLVSVCVDFWRRHGQFDRLSALGWKSQNRVVESHH